MTDKKDLIRETKRLNKKYSSRKSNELVVNEAQGLFNVSLRAKRYKNGKPYSGSKLGRTEISIMPDYDSPDKVLNGLYKSDSWGNIKNNFSYYQKKSRK